MPLTLQVVLIDIVIGAKVIVLDTLTRSKNIVDVRF
jgi:hypothetical protein